MLLKCWRRPCNRWNGVSSIENRKRIELTEWLFRKASRRRVPLSGAFELSPVCNFSCPMCYVRKTRQEVEATSRGLLSAKEWLEIAKQAKAEGMLYLLLTGGEPFLWEGFWTLYEELAQMGLLISINSNGYLVDEQVVKRLDKLPPYKINITLYGGCDETYRNMCGIENGFTKVSRGITLLKEAGIPVKLNCSLTPENAQDLEKIAAYAQKEDLPLQVATYMFPPVRRNPNQIGCNDRFTPQEAAKARMQYFRMYYGEEKYRTYAQSLLENKAIESLPEDYSCKMSCRAGKASFWITWDGGMTPCGMMPEPKVDIRKQPFADAWKETVEQTDAITIPSTCAACEKKEICHLCAAMVYSETGNFHEVPTYLCETIKALQIEAKNSLYKEE